MPLNSNGIATLVPSYFVRNGDTVSPPQHNPVLEDLASMLSQMYVKDGRAPLTGPMAFSTGTVSAPSITFQGYASTGFYVETDGSVSFTMGGVKAFSLTDISNAGNEAFWLSSTM